MQCMMLLCLADLFLPQNVALTLQAYQKYTTMSKAKVLSPLAFWGSILTDFYHLVQVIHEDFVTLCVSYEIALWMDQLMKLKQFVGCVRKDQRYKRLARLRISHSPHVMECLITGNTHASLFIPVTLFNISSLDKYVPHILLDFFQNTPETTSFEDFTSFYNVVLILLFAYLSVPLLIFWSGILLCVIFLLMAFFNWVNYQLFMANTITKSKQDFFLSGENWGPSTKIMSKSTC